MGLLDFKMPGMDTPEGQGLLSAAFALMSAQKYPGQKGALSGALGDAGRSYLQTTNQSRDQAMKRRYMDIQMQEAQSQIEARRLAAAAAQQKQATLENIFGRSVSPGAFSPSIDGRGPTMPPQMAGGSGIGGMSIDQVAKLKAMAGVDLMDAYKWAKDPLKLEQGSTYQDRITGARQYMPKVGEGIAPNSNGFYGELPGYGAAQASIEGAKAGAVERAKANLDLVPVPQSDGTTRTMPRSQAVQSLGNQRPQPASAPDDVRQEQVRIIRSEYDKEADPANKAALGRELMRLGADPNGVPKLGVTQSPTQALREKKVVEADADRAVQSAKDSKVAARLTSAADRAIALLSKGPTESGIGTAVDKAASMFGVTPKGAQVADQLRTLSGWMVANVPRMEGPQSNFDVQNYQTMAGIVGDSTVPTARRIAAAMEVKRLQEKYAELNESSGGATGGWDVEQKPNDAKAAPAMPSLPPAQQHKGRTVRDTATGKMLKSNGMSWVEVK